MAGDWIKFRKDLPDDPAVLGMSHSLRANVAAVVVQLLKFWSWADSHSDTGFIKSATPEWLDDYVRQPGFAAAMASEGWLDVDASGLTIPNFLRHNGKSAKKRLMAAERRRRSRLRHADVTEKSHNKRDECHADSSLLFSNKKKESATETFELFWKAFPAGRKQGKGKARAAWVKAVAKATPEVVIAAAAEYAASPVGRGEFVKGPEPWLNGECWADDRAAWNREDKPNGKPAKVKQQVASDYDLAHYDGKGACDE